MANESTVSYSTKGTCSKRLDLTIEDGIIKSCSFDQGCTGNLTGISALVVGREVDQVIDLLQGIQCRNGTSCPDQLAKALVKFKADRNAQATGV
ncbi:MAG: TIGR03905 family TSCPD domain-containing protein [Oscillospiraceae bacterium]|nr:TIGR03905 family TSCPD domain-containing protein [Oscillospiraceae bacterium]